MLAIPTRSRLAAATLLLCALGCTPAATPLPVQQAPVIVSVPGQAPATSAPEKPNRPLAIPIPPAPSSDYEGQDLSKGDGDKLASFANQLAGEGNPGEAARFQYWAVKAGEGGEYSLACWTALAGDVEGAFYWLQEAALDDGVDASWAGQDPDLKTLHKDARWKQITPFLKQCNAYWAASGHRQTVVVLPDGYQKGTPIGVLVGMHGLGHRPDGFVDKDTYQTFANELNMAIVGVSGTIATGRRSFIWSEDPPTDARQIRRALADLSDRLTVKAGHIIAFGFSQGGQMGFEVAFQNPDEFRGAIVMSPGPTNRFFRLNKLTPSSKNQTQGFVCLCGAGEGPGNVAFTKNDAEFARNAGAHVELKLYEGMNRHTFPPDFAESLVRWVRFIEGAEPEKKPD